MQEKFVYVWLPFSKLELVRWTLPFLTYAGTQR